MAGTGLLHEYDRSGQVVLYDNYFNSCSCALVAGVDSTGVDAYRLALTLEEGNIDIRQGMELNIKFRNGYVMKLICAAGVGRNDVRYRRFKDYKVRYVTVYYYINSEQLVRLMEEDAYQLEVFNTRGIAERKLNKVKNKFTEIYNELSAKWIAK